MEANGFSSRARPPARIAAGLTCDGTQPRAKSFRCGPGVKSGVTERIAVSRLRTREGQLAIRRAHFFRCGSKNLLARGLILRLFKKLP